MTITLTTRDLYLMIEDRTQHLEGAAHFNSKAVKRLTNKMRELLDLFEEAAAREEIEQKEREKQLSQLAAQRPQSGS